MKRLYSFMLHSTHTEFLNEYEDYITNLKDFTTHTINKSEFLFYKLFYKYKFLIHNINLQINECYTHTYYFDDTHYNILYLNTCFSMADFDTTVWTDLTEYLLTNNSSVGFTVKTYFHHHFENSKSYLVTINPIKIN